MEEIHELTSIDPWFLEQLRQIVDYETSLSGGSLEGADRKQFLQAKRMGVSDPQLAASWNSTEIEVRNRRKELGVAAVFNRVDTCSAEFESFTPYLYSTYETACESNPTSRKKVMILGSGPNRIGQGSCSSSSSSSSSSSAMPLSRCRAKTWNPSW